MFNKVLLIIILSILFHSSYAQTKLFNSGWQFVKEDSIHKYTPDELLGENINWKNVVLPHCFNAFDAFDREKGYFQGKGWYKNSINVNDYPINKRVILYFEGSGQKTTLWINNKMIGSNIGGYNEFYFDISEALKENINDSCLTLLICADNTYNEDMIPSNLSDFFIYGGIYGNLWIKCLPQVSIKSVRITTELNSDLNIASVDINPLIYNPTGKYENVKINIVVYDPFGEKVYNEQFLENTKSLDHYSLQIQNPELWDVEDPNLYKCEISIETSTSVHKYIEKFGIRDFEFKENGPFFLNGKRLLIKGTSRHHDHAGVGNAMDSTQIRNELLLIKDMGANFIRLGHYQQPKYVLDLCDSLGILAWEEIPWCRGGVGSKLKQKMIFTLMKKMINQHYNHPSIIIWGLGNEIDWVNDKSKLNINLTRKILLNLNDTVHLLDSTRMTALRNCPNYADIPDIYSPSIWAGWYSGLYTDYKSILDKEKKKYKHFFHAEWGASHCLYRVNDDQEKINDLNSTNTSIYDDNLDGKVNLLDKDWSSSYACNLFDWYLKTQEQDSLLTGSAFWIFKDFGTPLRPLNPIPYVNQKGVVERDLKKKSTYYVVQSYWAKKAMVHIHNPYLVSRSGKQNEVEQVKVYSNCDSVELIINDSSCCIRKRNPSNFPAAGLRWNIVFNVGENVLVAYGFKNGNIVTDVTEIIYDTTDFKDPADFVIDILSINYQSGYFQIKLVDSDQNLCRNANVFINISIKKGGKIKENFGTSDGSSFLQLSNGVARFHVLNLENQIEIEIDSDIFPHKITKILNTN